DQRPKIDLVLHIFTVNLPAWRGRLLGDTMAATVESLIELASAGDGAALATLLQEYEPKLLEYVRRRLPRAVETLAGPEDIVQDTWYEAWRMIHGFRSQGNNSFYRWLIRFTNLRTKATIQKFRTRRSNTVWTAVADR